MSYLHIYMSNQQSVGIFRSVEDVTFLLRCRLNTVNLISYQLKWLFYFPQPDSGQCTNRAIQYMPKNLSRKDPREHALCGAYSRWQRRLSG